MRSSNLTVRLAVAVAVAAVAVSFPVFFGGCERHPPTERRKPARARKQPVRPGRVDDVVQTTRPEAEPRQEPALPRVAPPEPKRFEPVGLGGGGAMYTPASSPHDPELMFVNCDMSGSYRSTDGGRTWEMIDFRQTKSSTVCKAAFHPTDPDVVFFKGLLSGDRGVTWKPLNPDAPYGRDVVEMATDPEDGDVILVGTSKTAYISRDAGGNWQECEGVSGYVVGMYVDPTSGPNSRRIFIATSGAVYRSDDGGRTFADRSSGLPWRGIRDMAGGVGTKGKPILYCTIPSKKENGEFRGGVYVSDDLAERWRPVVKQNGGAGLNKRLGKVDRWGAGDIPQYFLLGVAERRAELVYVTGKGTGYWPPHHSTVYRSEDAGRTWRFIYNRDFRFVKYAAVEEGRLNVDNGWIPYALTWIWGGFHTGNGFTVNPRHPNVLMWTDGGTLDISQDGGKSWRGAYSRYAPGQGKPSPQPGKDPGYWQSVGLEVTSTWEYHVDPFDHARHYICYTDVGFAISTDGGRSWRNNSRSGGSPWTNTTYMIKFDPERKGRAWAAMSNRHDIPHWTHTHDEVEGPGGVCVTDDHCEHWKVSSDGLPDAPCTSIALDLKSPVSRRTLYVSMFNHGVFKSVDDGRKWKAVNSGIALDRNNHAFLVKLHPDGTLFCCVTARRVGGRRSHDFPEVGALYRSRDGGESWEDITISRPLHWPNGFDFDPKNSDVIYLAAATIPGGREGGVYKTTDGGRTWTRVLRDEDFEGKGGPSYVHGMFVTVDPLHPDVVYFGTGSHGLWYTKDAGKSWHQFEHIPFGNAHRVTFDPDDHGLIYVTTFGGGVWRGRAPAP